MIRLAVSNIAWDVSEDSEVAVLLRKYQIDAIDIAPGKYFPQPLEATLDDILAVKQWWENNGISITGMQALLFGTSGLNLFGGSSVQDEMLRHLDAVCRIAAGLGATRLVFGSPKNRDRTGLTDKQALDIAVPFFRRLGDIASLHGVTVCLEPNPRCYGANFMTTTLDTAEVVRSIAHSAIKMQLDTGAIVINQESIDDILFDSAGLIGHIHASEPALAPLGDLDTNHREISKALRKYSVYSPISIEMLATKDEPHLASIERAICCAIDCYRCGESE